MESSMPIHSESEGTLATHPHRQDSPDVALRKI
jgi:hypothetical protein